MEVNKEKILKNINAIIATVLVVVCFIPMFKLNAQDIGYVNNLTASGWQALMGLVFTDGTVLNMSFSAILLYFFPVAIILVNFVRQLEKFKSYIIYISPIGCIIALFVTKMSVDSKMQVSVSTSIGFWLYLFLSIALLLLSYLQFKNISLNEEEIREFVKQSQTKVMDVSQELFSVTCPQCGNKVGKGKKYCTKCGYEMPQNVQKDVKCPKCGKNLPNSVKFCPDCGESIPKQESKPIVELKCKSCGAKIESNDRFCVNCGTKVGEE